MKLPRYSASTPPPRSSGIARATNIGALTQSSEQVKWSGVGAFGRGLNFAGQMAFSASLELGDFPGVEAVSFATLSLLDEGKRSKKRPLPTQQDMTYHLG